MYPFGTFVEKCYHHEKNKQTNKKNIMKLIYGLQRKVSSGQHPGKI